MLTDANLWIAVSFIIFAYIIWSKGRGFIVKALDKRIEDIRKDIETAENLRVEAQELLAQYQRKHRDAVKDAENIVANAEKQAAAIREKAEKDLSETIARREKQMKERIERMEQGAIAEIQKYAADLSIEATAEIIAEQLDKKAGEKLIDQAIKDVSKNIH